MKDSECSAGLVGIPVICLPLKQALIPGEGNEPTI